MSVKVMVAGKQDALVLAVKEAVCAWILTASVKKTMTRGNKIESLLCFIIVLLCLSIEMDWLAKEL